MIQGLTNEKIGSFTVSFVLLVNLLDDAWKVLVAHYSLISVRMFF